MSDRPEKHFRNFLGPPGTAICSDAAEKMAEDQLTLIAAGVTCERCLERLGRLRQGNFGSPTPRTHPKGGN